MKLEKPKIPISDSERTKLLNSRAKFNLVTSAVFIIFGLGFIVSRNHYFTVPTWLNVAAEVVLPIVMILLFVGIFRFARYDLSPKDEFEVTSINQTQSKSYELLTFGLLILIALSDHIDKLSWPGVLFVLLGVIRLYDSYQSLNSGK